jgi:hypothetical protein
MNRKVFWLISGIMSMGVATMAWGLEDSLGEKGIQARKLHQSPYNLTGKKIAIGQVEIGRPGKFGFDKAISWNPEFSLGGVFYRDQLAKSDTDVDSHATMVAKVMVSRDKRWRGVAPDARLFSSAVGSLKEGGQPEECLASQHIALQNSGDVRAINFSFGESLQRDSRKDPRLDGNALLTLCIDWSARVHNVLYVVAGNQGRGGIPIPTDQYNGITTAYTMKRSGKFSKVDFANLSGLPVGIGRRLIKRETNVGNRRSVGLLAPGNKITVTDLDGKITEVSGTSFAAPHITASVALLQEYGDLQNVIDPNWTTASRQHEVMKAVFFNSADKLDNVLGMTRTIFNKHNQTWLESEAFKDDTIPLDIEMGSGHLNAFRAYQQFSAGQWNPEKPVPLKGWNYGTVNNNSAQDYILENTLEKDSFISITLAWDRRVELNDLNRNERFDLGETFTDQGLNNLDLYLLPVDQDNNSGAVCASRSEKDSVEHIFCKVPATGQYKIRVHYRQKVNETTQPYGLAWWSS